MVTSQRLKIHLIYYQYFLDSASENYENKNRNGLAKTAKDIGDIIYDTLKETGYYE